MADAAIAENTTDLVNGSGESKILEAPTAKGSKTVLTLFGGDRQAKQLFSSLGKRKSPGADDLSEQALPNGISTTEIIPTHSLDDGDGKKGATIRDRFPPASTLAPLAAPRPSKHTTSRSGPVTWYTPSLTSKRSTDRRTLSNQPLPTGHWLTYNAPPLPRQQSPETKRKQRDRTLSLGEAHTPANEEVSAAHNHAKDDALFRSVYSSFAPDRDDSLAVIAAQEKGQVWYSRYGEEMYFDLLASKSRILHGDVDDSGQGDTPINEDQLKQALETWVPPESEIKDPFLVNGAAEIPEEEAEHVLGQISDLLEVVNSYQQIRFETIPVAARTSTGSVPMAPKIAAQLTGPTPPEAEAYENLKNLLISLVSDLPPYILSKLDGDKLGALKISTKIQVEAKNQKGTLLEDELSIKARAAVRPPVPAPTTHTPSSYSGARGAIGYQGPTHTPSNQFARPPYGTPASAPRTGPSQTYSSNHYANRPIPTGYPAGASRPAYPPQGSYGSQRPPSYTERFTNGTAQYTPQPSYSNYTNTGYRPQAQATTYSPQYSTPQARAPGSAAAHLQAYRASQADYQQRISAPGPGYGYGNAPVGTGTSPQPSPQQRLSFSTQGQAPTPQRPQLHHQHSSNPGSRSPQPQTNGASAVPGGTMSADDQAALMNRQKAQLAEAAQQIRQASRTPQPGAPNGGSRNGTPGRQQGNG